MSHFISKSAAITMLKKFREHRRRMLGSGYGEATLPFCETFDAGQLRQLLDKGAVKVRMYLGMNERNELIAVMVGANEEGVDILPESHDGIEEGYIIEDGKRCPPDCPPASSLYP